MNRLWKNWPVHNLLAHPLSEVAYWIVWPVSKLKAEEVSGAIHDATLPDVYEQGRG